MPICSVMVNVADVARSVDFYASHLGARVVGEPSRQAATIDMVSATIALHRIEPGGTPSSWRSDDLQRGFRHLGFKVAAVDPILDAVRRAGIRAHLGPLEAEGGVRIAFFPDPDGTMLEVVERDLRYTRTHDVSAVAAERVLGVPKRPRFDHLAVTVADLDRALQRYRALGFDLIGTLEQPQDSRGFTIHYARSGDTVLELFTYARPTTARTPQLDSPGYLAATIPGPADDRIPAGQRGGHQILADADDLLTTAA